MLMKQTPAHSVVNQDLLGLIPPAARRVVEVGCMHGAMARAYRATNPAVEYVGIDIDPDYAAVAASACTQALAGDIETFTRAAFDKLFPSDCWIFASPTPSTGACRCAWPPASSATRIRA